MGLPGLLTCCAPLLLCARSDAGVRLVCTSRAHIPHSSSSNSSSHGKRRGNVLTTRRSRVRNGLRAAAHAPTPPPTPSVRRVTAGSRRWWGPRLRLQTHMPTRHQPSCRGLQHRHSDTNKSATSKADPRHQQDWILKCLQGREAPPLAACGVATLCGDTLHGWTETLQGLVCRSPSSVTLERTCVVHVQWVSSEDDGAEQMTYVRRVIASSGRTPPWPLSAVGRAIRGPSQLLPVTR